MNKIKQQEDGWNRYNPNHVKCDCGSSDVEFYWQRLEPVAMRCNSCGFEIWNEK
jgi:hypothetical protein